MAYPYHVYTKTNHIGLYQLNDGRFQMTMQGNLTQIMEGYQYVILEKSLANFLKDLKIDSVEFKDTIVWNQGLNIEYNN